MSVLSSPQGVPERVWSLVGGLAGLGGKSDRETLDRLINPGFEKDGILVQAAPKLAGDALGAASSLGLVLIDKGEAHLGDKASAASPIEFSDHVHDILVTLSEEDTDRVLLEGYAWIAAESDRQEDLAWIYELSREEFADKANEGLVGDDEDGRAMNPTKAVAWRRWLLFLGLGVPLPLTHVPDFPSPASRIARELERARVKRGEEMPAGEFLKLLAKRMPYLDGGSLFIQACKRIGHKPKPRRLSPLLSAALRDLHDEQAIVLRPVGDSADMVRLSDDPAHEIQTFNRVRVRPETGAKL
jgi:hypothetical protein